MEKITPLKSTLVLTLLIVSFLGCESYSNKRIDTPYGVGIKADELNVITDKEIEYYIVEDEFIYFHKKNEDVATYIIPKKNITIITPLEKP